MMFLLQSELWWNFCLMVIEFPCLFGMLIYFLFEYMILSAKPWDEWQSDKCSTPRDATSWWLLIVPFKEPFHLLKLLFWFLHSILGNKFVFSCHFGFIDKVKELRCFRPMHRTSISLRSLKCSRDQPLPHDGYNHHKTNGISMGVTCTLWSQ